LPTGPRHRSRTTTGSHRRVRMIDIAGGGAPQRRETGGGRATGGARLGKCNGHRPPDDGLGNRPPPSPVGRHWTIGRRRVRDGHVKQRAAAGSSAPWHTCQNAGRECDGGTRLLTGPQVQEINRPAVECGWTIGQHRGWSAVGTFGVCSNAVVKSDLSCCLYTGWAKKPDCFPDLITLWRLVLKRRAVCQNFQNFMQKKGTKLAFQ